MQSVYMYACERSKSVNATDLEEREPPFCMCKLSICDLHGALLLKVLAAINYQVFIESASLLNLCNDSSAQ